MLLKHVWMLGLMNNPYGVKQQDCSRKWQQNTFLALKKSSKEDISAKVTGC